MATKRPHPDSAVHPSRLAQVPPEPSRKRRKQTEKPAHITGPSFKKAHPVHDLKAQIRSLRRLLEHTSISELPATVRVEKERALQSAQRELIEAERARKRSDIIGRWHKKLREAELDVKYAIYYPLEKEYVPLFAKKKKQEDAAEADEESPEPAEYEREGDPEMWQLVKKCMTDGTLEALRNGKLTADKHDLDPRAEPKTVVAQPVQPKNQRQKADPKPLEGNRRERRKAAATAKAGSDDDSEGGFFE
ncbi:hypothetical protein LTR48_001092 [Friedmanniomyces endolithicus]|uniref:rRNA-processing protein EFG1 n=1 Tax=Rachicladosporium monterosium TaxID=1507873 RepID=A0ABR0LFD3_9PEZI|nr:hypothetical protein LTR48_001092 [Friedmanniomyces endolithicus]KAK5147530.1 hypothetical protein LTR32_001033 [Rachicladosporium monterosium]